jgi:hypothetical protein
VNASSILAGLKKRLRRPPEAEKPTLEQLKDQIELAEQFDKLQNLPIWQKLLERMALEVNGELTESTKYIYDPVRQTAHVVRWCAKRELLDNTLGWIDGVQLERDRIVAEFTKEQEDGGSERI